MAIKVSALDNEERAAEILRAAGFYVDVIDLNYNVKLQTPPVSPIRDLDGVRMAQDYLFRYLSWEKTDEGEDFWDEVFNNLENYIENLESGITRRDTDYDNDLD